MTPEDVQVGERIKARRMQQHMSQSDLGVALGVTFQQIQKYEKGINRISAGRLVQLSETLKTTTEYFLGGVQTGYVPTDLDAAFARFLTTKDGVAIIEAMLNIDRPKLRTKVIELARLLAE